MSKTNALKRLTMLGAMMAAMMAALPAMGQTNYVFYNATYGYLYNDNGTLKSSAILQYDKSSVWIASGAIGTTSRTIQSYTDRQYLGNGGSLSGTTANWRGYNNYLAYRSGNTNYYLKATSATAFTTNSNSNNGQRYYYYTVTLTDYPEQLADFSINSGADAINATGNYAYGHTNTTYRQAYVNYYFNSANHYVLSDNTQNGTTLPATTAVNTGYTWSLSVEANGYATVNSATGEITVSTLPDVDMEMVLTCSVSSHGLTKTATKTIKLRGTHPIEPTITRNGNDITIATTSDGATIYYTLDGSEPTSSSNMYSTPFNVFGETYPLTIKAVAIRTGNASTVASVTYTSQGSGVGGGMVILNDLEDHSWSYYSDADCPIRSLSPADVKITYYGDGIMMTGNDDYTASSTDFVQPGQTNYTGGAKVNVGGDDENTFVYFKTLERGDATQTAWTYSTGNQSAAASRCPYTTIPNPFQVRPTYGSLGSTDPNSFTGWRGFQCWRLKSVTGGSVYSAASGGTALSTGAVINGETQIYFAPNSEYGMAVELEAVWARAYLIKGDNANANNILAQNVGVERNFMTLTAGENYRFNYTSGRRISNTGYPVTISCYYPNGTVGNAGATISGNTNNITLGADTKFENVTLSAGSYTLSGSGHYLIVGRGCANSSIGTVQGLSANSTSNIKFRVESGSYTNLYFMGTYGVTTGTMVATMGSDYDRAKNDNSKLRVTNDIVISNGGTVGTNGTIGTERFTCTVKSGNYYLTSDAPGGGYQFYISSPNGACYGKRTLIVEGGYFADIAGGIDQENVPTSTDMVNIRIKGGEILGAVYGAAQFANAYGNRRIIVTGGDFSGWIAGGANGTQETRGALYGSSYVYVGGDAHIDGSNTVINRAVGGNVFGAGCGYSANSTSGQVTIGTNVVISDDAYIGRGVYGGGSYGYTTQTANIYILGGTIDGKNGGVTGTAYLAAIDGGVYGGACQNQGGTVNLTMSGGTVNGSIYGGSNYTGTLSGTSTVTLNGGTVNGSIYGGGNGEGNPTNVTGAVQVTVNGGTVTGAVYGCGNVSGAPQSTVNVDVYGTDPQPGSGYAINQVFGGGNAANYSGTPVVTVHDDNGCDISIGEVYGGGNAATVTGTNVTIEGGNKIGNVFGGCYGANVTTNGTKVNVKGGTIGKVFGGNNQSGTITGAIKVRVDKDGTCPMKIGELYGGGNMAASAVGSIDIGCTGDLTAAHATCNETDNRIGYDLEGIGDVYAGANAAAVTGNVNLTIDSGMVYRVFGNNNTSASVSGTITVNIDKQNDACGWYVGHVYGGGNRAPYTAPNATPNYPAVNVKNGMVSHNVFGGGLGTTATVTGNPQVILSGTAEVGGNVYGGGNAAPVSGNTKVTLRD